MSHDTKQTKHTPGPWELKINGSGFTLYSDLYGDEGYTILHQSGPVTRIDEANARLIAAAPELLEALIRLREFLRLDTNPYALKLCNKADIAIVKAEGR